MMTPDYDLFKIADGRKNLGVGVIVGAADAQVVGELGGVAPVGDGSFGLKALAKSLPARRAELKHRVPVVPGVDNHPCASAWPGRREEGHE